MNYQTKIKTLRGEEYPKSFPQQREVDKLPMKKDKSGVEFPDQDKLERETVGNVILNCLTVYRCEDRKDGYYVNLIAQTIIGSNGKDVILKDKLKEFLIEVMDKSIMKEEIKKDAKGNETKEQTGIYAGWVLSQCLTEMGVTIDKEL
jgi:hypothetical protein